MKFRAAALFLVSTTAPYALSFQIGYVPTQAAAAPSPPATCLFSAVEDHTSSSSNAPKVTRLENSAVSIDIPVPGSATKAAYDKVCAELSKKITIPGFRKGSKIPPQILEQNMAAKGGRNAIKVQAINELLGQLIEPALKEQALDPIGQPTLKVPAETLAETFKPGEDLVLQVQCDVWPEIKWRKQTGDEKPYLGLAGKYQRRPFDQVKLDKALNDLKERYAALEPIADASHVLQMGDACTVNMNGFMATESGEKGDPLPNAASGDRVEVVLGQGRYMEGLVEGLVGARVGDTVTVSVNFPEVGCLCGQAGPSIGRLTRFLLFLLCRNFETRLWLERKQFLMLRFLTLPSARCPTLPMNSQPKSSQA
jgi:Bacterial trigger factor protein (TF)/FKBP-type peptidyl-prolyl cis-trans isomerase